MKTIKKALLSLILFIIWTLNLSVFSLTFAQNNPYQDSLNLTVSDNTSQSALISDAITDWTWWKAFNNQVLVLAKYIIDVFIIIWIAVAFFGGYKIMVSWKEDATKEWINLVIFWILWIIIMVSARFLASSLVGDNGIIPADYNENNVWINLASNLYEKIMFPFIKVVLYLVVWALFFMMVAKVISFATATDDSAKKKASWIIIRTIVGILIIMWSKQLVEAVMWRQDTILNPDNPQYVWDLWNNITTFWSIPLIAQIINWIMWLTMFIVLVLVIVQAYSMFTKPDDPKNRERLKKTIIYIIIWVLVIGASYAISSVLVVNRL